MTLVLDAGALYAQVNRAEPAHAAVIALLKAETGPLVTTEAVVAEADYLIGARLGGSVDLAFLDDLAERTVGVECLARLELVAARDLARRYHELRLGLADAPWSCWLDAMAPSGS